MGHALKNTHLIAQIPAISISLLKDSEQFEARTAAETIYGWMPLERITRESIQKQIQASAEKN